MGTSKIQSSLLLIIMASSLLAACSSTTTGTPTPSATTATISPAETQTAIINPTSTSTPAFSLTATSQVETMKQDMQKLADQKLVSNAEGNYFRVQDFTGEWAKLGYYHWWPLNRKPTNFSIRADVTWETAVPNANLSKAGCGFVFHEQGADNLHFSYLSMDGVVRNYRVEKKVFADLQAGTAGKFKYPSDSAKIMLVVDHQWIAFFVNNKMILRFKDNHLNGGGLSYAVASGTNNGFGTRCTFQNVELWEFN
ncbi:MAG TPA: hypothetical protein VF338_07410 [Leptolinea sp.]